MQKQELPLVIEDLDKEIQNLVCVGAMRRFITNFYKFGVNIIIKKYGIDDREQGHRYVCSTLFDAFASANASEFKNLKRAKHRYLDFIPLCYYAVYLQGVFNHLTQYQKIHGKVSPSSFERLVENFAYNFRQRAGQIVVHASDTNAKDKYDKITKELYDRYDLINSDKVQTLVDKTLRENIYVNPELFNAPFILDLEGMKNNGYFDKRKLTYYNYEIYPDLQREDEREYQEYRKNNPEAFVKNEKEERVYNEAYDIPDEFFELENN